jgi:alkylhydroperoxidase family enzyme
VDLNAAGMLRAEETEAKTLKVGDWRNSDLFSRRERTALAFAEAVTLSDRDVDDELFAAAREVFAEDEIVELTAWIGLENLYSKFNRAFRIEAQGFCTLPLAVD